MWKAKFKVYDETGIFMSIAMKYKIKIYGYMFNYFFDKNSAYFTLSVFPECDPNVRNKIKKELLNAKKVDKLEDQGNFFICRLKISWKTEKERRPSLFYNPLIIQVKPFIIYQDGWEELEFASFDRKYLEEILEISEEKYKLKLIYLKKEKIDNFGVVHALPSLTEKQKQALDMAISNGYYKYPRRIDIKKLAKINKLSYSTFQEHLRKAENKLVPFSASNYSD